MRNKGIDFFRLLAAFSVISLHTGLYTGFQSEEVGATLRLLARWAGPFFFIVSGYFIGKNESINRAIKPLSKFVAIFIISTVALLPLRPLSGGIIPFLKSLSTTEFLLGGALFHLWYLQASIIGLLVILTCDHLERKWLLPIFAALSLMACIIGTYSSNLIIPRYFSGIGFMYIGILLRTTQLGSRTGFALCLIGLAAQEIETHMLHHYLNISILDPQILVSTIIYAIGMFEISRSGTFIQNESASNLGANHSLFIYLFHPYVLHFDHKFLEYTSMFISRAAHDILIIPIVFFITFGISICINKITPSLFRLLNGDIFPKANLRSE